MRVGTIDGVEIRIWSDEEPYDWGDYDPSESERTDLSVIGVAVHLAGDDDPISVKYVSGRPGEWRTGYGPAAVWGIGFTEGTAEREAVSTVLECGWMDDARREIAERAYWSARDVVTVEA